MTKSSDWKVLSDETSSDPVSDNNEQNDTQSSERKRRLLSGSKPKTHRKYIQDIVTFLKNKDLEEDVKYEHRKNTRGSEASVEEDEWKQHVDTERSCPRNLLQLLAAHCV